MEDSKLTRSHAHEKLAPASDHNDAINRALVRKYLEYLATMGSSENTVLTYGQRLSQFIELLRPVCILKAEHSDLLRCLDALYRRGLGKSSVALTVHSLKSFERFCSLAGLPRTPAIRALQAPKVPRRIGQSHSLAEVEKIIDAARTPRERALIEMLFATGCRISELRGIRVEQINWQNRSVEILGKGNKQRVVFFGEPAEKAVRAFLSGRTEGFLFPGRAGPALSVKHLERIVQTVGARVDLRSLPHNFRHAMASALLNSGANLRAIQELLGHSSLSTTSTYLHSSQADLKKVHESFHPREEKSNGEEKI